VTIGKLQFFELRQFPKAIQEGVADGHSDEYECSQVIQPRHARYLGFGKQQRK
jgi:hypothetical protein